ncbi:hypothetical protein BH09PSE1_BH09PSE1_05180 [soil metagenome]
MRTQHYQPDATSQSSDQRELWLWAVVNDRGVEVDRGRTADQASAIRHARRSALQRQGALTIKVVNPKAIPAAGLRWPQA